MFATDLIIFASFCVLCTAALIVRYGESVERMQVVEDNSKPNSNIEQVMESAMNYSHPLLQLMLDDFKPLSWNTKTQVTPFKWKNCGSSSDLLVVNALSVTPDPLRLPGDIGLSFDVTIQETFTAPLKVEIKLERKVFKAWIRIPCVYGFGSCTFDDICPTLENITCPEQFGTTIPCKCPFTEGRYSLPSSSFRVTKKVPIGGLYWVRARLSHESKPVNCIEIYFNVRKR